MHRMPVIALIILMLAVPISGFAQAATPAARRWRAATFGSGRYWRALTLPGVPRPGRSHGDPGIRAIGRTDVWSRDLEQPAGARTMVLPGVAQFTRVCAYDRPGTMGEVNSDLDPYGPLFYPSRSDPVPQPRTTQEKVETYPHSLTPRRSPAPMFWSLIPPPAW